MDAGSCHPVPAGVIAGEYDGYGKIVAECGVIVTDIDAGPVFHRACWTAAGEPTDTAGMVWPLPADDQGYFSSRERTT